MAGSEAPQEGGYQRISGRTTSCGGLRTKRGRACYKLRQTNVEPVIGQIKEGRQLRQVLHRGREKVRALWRFDVAVHNLLKLYRAGAVFGYGA